MKLGSEEGQSIVLVAVLILSFLMFFTFAVNTGLLIAAKISVQTAADAAAYAGAATEARLLNGISFLNYDMRRQYKKYIFRTNFVGAMGSPDFPQPLAQNSSVYDFPKLDFTLSTPSKKSAMKVPIICIPLTIGGKADDNCLRINVANSAYALSKDIGTGIGVDAIISQFLANVNATNQLQQTVCHGQGQLNLFVLLTWLFRGNADDTSLDSILLSLKTALSDKDYQAAKSTISTLVQGLGLYPRNIINLMRIETLAGFLNGSSDVVGQELTSDKILTLESGINAEAHEKTIQAFRSAAANLNASVFDSTLTSITELENPNQIKINPVKVDFNAYIQMMQKDDNNTGASTICNSSVFKFPALGAPVGVTIDPSLKVNYAVKVKAYVKPRGLLFLPGSEPLELDAVAGAKPFGSRIAPHSPLTLVRSVTPGSINGEVINDCKGQAQCNLPDLDVGAGSTMISVDYLTELMNRAKSAGVMNFMTLLGAEWHAMAPTPEETGHYNILPPSPTQLTAQNYPLEFIDYANASVANPMGGAPKKVYRFYAPLFAAGGPDPKAKVDQFLSQIFVNTAVGVDPKFGISMKDIGISVGTTIKQYLVNIDKVGEMGETTTLASLELGMDGLTKGRIKDFWLTDANQVLSSWAPDAVRTVRTNGDGPQAFAFKPRFGFSVKFVAMSDLINEGVDPNTDPDLSKVNH